MSLQVVVEGGTPQKYNRMGFYNGMVWIGRDIKDPSSNILPQAQLAIATFPESSRERAIRAAWKVRETQT